MPLRSSMLLAATFIAFAPGCAVEEQDDIATEATEIYSIGSSFCRPRLPDLVVQDITDLKLESVNGNVYLRFSTNIGNVGAGPYEFHMIKEPDPGYRMTYQRVYCTPGDRFQYLDYEITDHADPSSNHGDPSSVNNPEIRVDSMLALSLIKNGVTVASDLTNSCMSDAVSLSRWEPFKYAPGSPTYTSCRLNDGPWAEGDDAPTMGLSAGWANLDDWHKWEPGDPNPRTYQILNITSVPDGTYTLRAAVFGPGAAFESNTTNQWKDLTISINKGALSVSVPSPTSTCKFCL